MTIAQQQERIEAMQRQQAHFQALADETERQIAIEQEILNELFISDEPEETAECSL